MSKLNFYCHVSCKLLISINNLDIIFIYQLRRHFLYKILGYYIIMGNFCILWASPAPQTLNLVDDCELLVLVLVSAESSRGIEELFWEIEGSSWSWLECVDSRKSCFSLLRCLIISLTSFLLTEIRNSSVCLSSNDLDPAWVGWVTSELFSELPSIGGEMDDWEEWEISPRMSRLAPKH